MSAPLTPATFLATESLLPHDQKADLPPSDISGRTQLESLHREVATALLESSFKQDAAGKSGEVLKIAVARAIADADVGVEVISVGLADPKTHPTSPYEAIWQWHGGAIEKSYFDV